MIWIGILLLLVFVALFFVCLVFSNTNEVKYYLLGAFGGVILASAIGIIVCCFNPQITPMDVYQGKTTLKYEVVDGVKVDSTVVWKNN